MLLTGRVSVTEHLHLHLFTETSAAPGIIGRASRAKTFINRVCIPLRQLNSSPIIAGEEVTARASERRLPSLPHPVTHRYAARHVTPLQAVFWFGGRH